MTRFSQHTQKCCQLSTKDERQTERVEVHKRRYYRGMQSFYDHCTTSCCIVVWSCICSYEHAHMHAHNKKSTQYSISIHACTHRAM